MSESMAYIGSDIRNEFADLAELSVDERHRLLQADRRRATLSILAEASPPIPLEDLAASITDREDRSDVPHSEQQTRAKIALHHNHLPKLDDLGIIDYDRDSNRVTT